MAAPSLENYGGRFCLYPNFQEISVYNNLNILVENEKCNLRKLVGSY